MDVIPEVVVTPEGPWGVEEDGFRNGLGNCCVPEVVLDLSVPVCQCTGPNSCVCESMF